VLLFCMQSPSQGVQVPDELVRIMHNAVEHNMISAMQAMLGKAPRRPTS
jgi:hypothetical protein